MGRGRETTRYDRLKRILLNNPLIAAIVVGATILGGVAAVLGALGGIWQLFRPSGILVLSMAAPHTTKEFLSVPVTFEVALSTSELGAVTDAVITIGFRGKGGAPLEPEAVLTHFALASSRITVPALSPASPIRKIETTIRAQRAGTYAIVATVVSQDRRLKAEASSPLEVDQADFSTLVEIAPAESPLLIVRNGVADADPIFLNKLSTLKVLIPEEAIATSPEAATVWLQADYVGSLGGLIWTMYRLKKPGSAKLENLVGSRMPDAASLQEIGTLEAGSGTALIGSSTYRLQIIDEQRIRVEETTSPCRPLKLLEFPLKNVYPSQSRWQIPELNLTFVTTSDCGATGRICDFELTFRNETYLSHEPVAEFGEEEWTDFPVMAPLGESKFLRFSLPDTASLGAEVCGVPR